MYNVTSDEFLKGRLEMDRHYNSIVTIDHKQYMLAVVQKTFLLPFAYFEKK
jgi:apolipoprotein N-acyltransferase